MQVKVDIGVNDIASAMENNPDFGAEVLSQFLLRLGHRPEAFARAANFRMCRVMAAQQLRQLAEAIESN